MEATARVCLRSSESHGRAAPLGGRLEASGSRCPPPV